MRILHSLIVALFLMALLGLTACGGSQGEDPAQDSSQVGTGAAGQQDFERACSVCHGPTGEGVPGLGKDMTTSQFIAGKTDHELVEFIKTGRNPSDPLNTTGVAMPPKGGNPGLTDQDLYDIVAYIRVLQEE